MQISSANTLIAAQQAKHAPPQAKPAGKPFAEALAGHDGHDSFAPLKFKQATAPAPVAPQAQNSAARLGSQLDIRI